MRAAIFLLFICSVLPARTPLESALLAIIQSRRDPHVLWGIHVLDLKSGRALANLNGAAPAVPASNTKLLTTALALRRLGPDFRVETRVLADAGPSPSGLVAGPLAIAGAGEPLASVDDLARLLWDANVRHVTGDIVGDDTVFPWEPYPDGWTIDDALYDYGAPLSALSLQGNVLPFSLLPGRPGEPAFLAFDVPSDYYTVLNETVSSPASESTLTWQRAAGSRVVRLTGAVPRRLTGALAVDDPALHAAQSLLFALRAKGVRVDGRAMARHRLPGEPYVEPSGVALVRFPGSPLSSLVSECNKKSNNLYAELLLRQVARARTGDGTLSAGLAEMESFLEELQIDLRGIHLEDGSGLSRKTLIAPAALTRLLAAMVGSGEFYESLPVAARDGSLRFRFAGVPGASRLRAKTGSYRHVTALSGYVDRRIAFSIIANQVAAPDSTIRPLVDRIAVEILRRTPSP